MSPTLLRSASNESLPSLTPQEEDLILLLNQDNPIWIPQEGAQTSAWLTPADELYYGGQAGGGKSFLLLGLALTAHQRSVIFRRNFTQFKGGEGLISKAMELIAGQGHWSSRVNGFLLKDGRTLEFGGLEDLGALGKWKGRAHDLIGFDELPEFLEQHYAFLIGWLRTTLPGQRTRVVGAGNPPTTNEGEWVIRRWAAWLDSQHNRPAGPGELRWYARLDDKDTEVEDGEPFAFKGEMVMPKSRTFIPASLTDNPLLARTGYASQLQSLPEPLRSQLLYGDFHIGITDDPWQVIPSAWVEAAMHRWREDLKPGGSADQAGLDVARGGSAKTVLAQRWGAWFAPLVKIPGRETPDGQEGRRLVVEALLRGGYVNVDVIGVGAAVVDLARQDVDAARVVAINNSSGVKRKDRTNQLRFVNVRAFSYWSLREALDPETGDGLMLPPDTELKADLCAARWSLRTGSIIVEEKEEISKRLGRSPDVGDALVLAAMPPIVAGVAFY
jgi:hypothetical protein